MAIAELQNSPPPLRLPYDPISQTTSRDLEIYYALLNGQGRSLSSVDWFARSYLPLFFAVVGERVKRQGSIPGAGWRNPGRVMVRA
jgi:hypothetical protein